MDKPIEPADVSVNSLGVRLQIMKGYWATLSPTAARALAHKILVEWPESLSLAEGMVEREKRNGCVFYECRFCGCNTNAFERACCELGQSKDRNRLTAEQMARWEEEAERWGYEKSGVHGLTRMLAGRILLLLDEVVRTRRKLDGVRERVVALERFAERCLPGGPDTPTFAEWERVTSKKEQSNGG